MQKRISLVHVIILAGKYDVSTKRYMPYNSANQLFYMITFLLVFVGFFLSYENFSSSQKSYLYKTIKGIVDHTTFVVYVYTVQTDSLPHSLNEKIHARIKKVFSEGSQI